MQKYIIDLCGYETQEDGSKGGELLIFKTLSGVDAATEKAAKEYGKRLAAELFADDPDRKITTIRVYPQNW